MNSSPVLAARSRRYPSNISFQAAAWTVAVRVSTPSRSNRHARTPSGKPITATPPVRSHGPSPSSALPSGTAPPARPKSPSPMRLLVVNLDPPAAAASSMRGPLEGQCHPDLREANRGSRPCPILHSLLPVLLREPPSSNEFTYAPIIFQVIFGVIRTPCRRPTV